MPSLLEQNDALRIRVVITTDIIYRHRNREVKAAPLNHTLPMIELSTFQLTLICRVYVPWSASAQRASPDVLCSRGERAIFFLSYHCLGPARARVVYSNCSKLPGKGRLDRQHFTRGFYQLHLPNSDLGRCVRALVLLASHINPPH
jgi:hypothetical protein